MTVNDVVKIPQLEVVNLEEDRPVESVFTCDLLSVCMAKAPMDGAWVTVMGNRGFPDFQSAIWVPAYTGHLHLPLHFMIPTEKGPA